MLAYESIWQCCHDVTRKYFTYRLNRARMVTEAGYGQLKGRWRLMYRRSKCTKKVVRATALECIVLHNICFECDDQMPAGSDLTVDPATNKRRDREKVRRLLKMKECGTIKRQRKYDLHLQNKFGMKNNDIW